MIVTGSYWEMKSTNFQSAKLLWRHEHAARLSSEQQSCDLCVRIPMTHRWCYHRYQHNGVRDFHYERLNASASCVNDHTTKWLNTPSDLYRRDWSHRFTFQWLTLKDPYSSDRRLNWFFRDPHSCDTYPSDWTFSGPRWNLSFPSTLLSICNWYSVITEPAL
jgi:hypothetical protein